jgi:CRISPR-associated protein Csm2
MELNKIKLDKLEIDIFSDTARNAAEHISQNKDKNKSTQLRKFYDELAMWHDKVFQAASREEAYQNAAPFIQMLRAKAAYSKGRSHVDDNFIAVFNQIIGQIHNADTLKNAKLFFEAVLGFRRANEQK